MNDPEIRALNRSTVINTLAVVGFVALIGASMWFAVYSTRFVPSIVNRIGEAAVYLGAVFSPAPAPALTVVPVASTTTVATAAAITTPATATTLKPASTTSGTRTTKIYQVAGTPAVTPHGLPDLAVTVTAVGYFKSCTDESSFIASTTVPSGTCPAIKFTIKNVGTNWTGTWRFSASIPTRTPTSPNPWASDALPSLSPGGEAPFVLGFDQATAGTQQIASILANFDHAVQDKNTANDSAVAYLNVL